MDIYYHLKEKQTFFGSLTRLLFSTGVRTNIIAIKSILMLAIVAGVKDLRVLLADDDEDDRNFFKEAVTEEMPNVQVSSVPDGEQLIRHLLNSEKLPHVVFLDLNMPIKNGWECLREIRTHPRLSKLPVIIYSTSSSREHIQKTYEDGASLYIRKPDSYTDLKTIARKVFAFDWNQHHQPAREKYLLTA